MSIAQNLQNFTSQIPNNVTLVAVSKTKPEPAIREAYETGHRIFGENKVQELVDKYERLPKDIKWHMIGHLQRNKVKYLASFIELIHGVDSFKTLVEINKQALKHNRIIDCLFQVKIAEEESKFGIKPQDVRELLNSEGVKSLSNVRIIGLMGMASFTIDMDQVRSEFKVLRQLFYKLKTEFSDLKTLSMGMSGDYNIAIQEGSTMIRVGSAIFGKRTYS